jgi:carboxylesterase type B
MESGSPTSSSYKSTAQYERDVQRVLNATGCADLACLRAAPIDTVIAATNQSYYSWFPVVDGTFLVDHPTKLMAAGKIARVPVLLGRPFIHHYSCTPC